MCIMAHAHRYSKRTESTSSKASNGEQAPKEEDNPNIVVYRKVSTLSVHIICVEINMSSLARKVLCSTTQQCGRGFVFRFLQKVFVTNAPRPPSFAVRHSMYLTGSTIHYSLGKNCSSLLFLMGVNSLALSHCHHCF